MRIKMIKWELQDVKDNPLPELDNKWQMIFYFLINITNIDILAKIPTFRINYQSQHVISNTDSQ